MALNEWNVAILHNKNPWMPMWWSAALPGMGHLCQGDYLKGLVLMSWEILVNFKANLNLGIIYTFTGQLDKAREVTDPGWALIYGVIFWFAIFDSYRNAVSINIISRLEQKQRQRNYRFMKMTPFGVNFLERGNPWLATAWSILLSGFGHLYNRKAFKGLIILGWAVAIIIFSKINIAIVYTFNGQFDMAREAVDYQWLLFFPSIYIFAMWDAYNDAVEMNKLFAEEQKEYLRKEYNIQKGLGENEL